MKTYKTQLSYLIEQLSDDGRIMTSIPLFLETPTDVVLAGEIHLKEHLKVEANRIFLNSDLKLYTYEHDLYIAAQTVVSDNAFIQNFPAGAQQAHRGKVGRSGGNIAIEAKNSLGSLRVVLTGEGGAQGKMVPLPFPAGTPGAPVPAEVQVELLEVFQSEFLKVQI